MEEVRGGEMRGKEGEGGKRMEVGRWVEEVRGWEDAWSNMEEEGGGRWVEEVGR